MSLLCLLLPLIFSFIYTHFNPDIIYSINNKTQINDLKNSFNPSLISTRMDTDIASDLTMLKFYIINNSLAGVRIFITGILLGTGTVLLLMFQGLSMGVMIGYIAQLGYGNTLWPFIIGHSSLELLASTFSGVGGLIIGRSLIKPKYPSRLKSFTTAFRYALLYVIVAIFLTIFAAIIETFWSSNINIDSLFKYTIGIILWLSVMHLFYSNFKKNELF